MTASHSSPRSAPHPALSAILTGVRRPTRVLPGEYGARFIHELYNEIGRHLGQEENTRFELVRACVGKAIDSANRHKYDEARQWVQLSERLCTMQHGAARTLSLSCVKSAESYVYFAQQDYTQALACLETANQEDQTLDLAQFPTVRAQRLHYQHLKSRIYLAQGHTAKAIDHLIQSLQEAVQLAASGHYHHPDLLSYACSRMAGELAMANGGDLPAHDYCALTAPLANLPTEGSVAEFLLYRNAYEALKLHKDSRQMCSFLEAGRMKTICWYCAVVDVAHLLAPSQRQDLATLSSQWRDMPAKLTSRLLASL